MRPGKGHHPPDRAPRHPARTAAALLLLLAAPTAAAQSVVAIAASDRGTGAIARVLGVRDGATTIDAWARIGSGVAGGAGLRWAETFGPLGNVIVEASLDGALALTHPSASDGARAAFGVRGVIGPVAASLRLDGGTIAEDALDLGARAEQPRLALAVPDGGVDVGLRAGVTYRPDRATVLTLDPRIRWSSTGWGAWASAGLRRSGPWPELDVWLGAEGGVVAGTGGGALGMGLVWTRRREPDSTLRLWLGGDEGGFRPGFEAAFASRVPGGSTTLSLALTPHRLDAPSWRVALDASVAATATAGTWRLAAAAAGTSSGTRWSVGLGLERPLPSAVR